MSEGRSVLLTRRKNYRCIVTTTDARQQLAGWASAFVPQLARDLHNELPELMGFSVCTKSMQEKGLKSEIKLTLSTCTL